MAASFDISIETPWPCVTDWTALAACATDAAAKVAPELANSRIISSILFTSDAELHALNREWRSRDQATNVLSFPMLERSELLALGPEGPPVMLGDIALACETCEREATGKGVSLEHHAAHLVVHGLLHLAGHDHELGAAEAEAMELLEIKALALMGIANPYEGQEQL